MYLIPQEEKGKNVDYDYAIIDPNLNATYFYDLKEHLVSLAPDYAKNTENVFPYLLRLNKLDKSLLEQIIKEDEDIIKKGGNSFFSFVFKSIPTREPDIIKHFKMTIVYELNNKKYLYRFYDPRVWLILNYKESQDFLYLNKFFKNIKISFCNKNHYFENCDNFDNDFVVDYELLKDINIVNRVLDILNMSFNDLEEYISKVLELFVLNKRLDNVGVVKNNDKIALIYHIQLLGVDFINTDFCKNIIKSSKGYEQASKILSTDSWNIFFTENKILDEKMRNKVMYEY